MTNETSPENPDQDDAQKPGFNVDQVDWPVVLQKASAITATALCLITFMYVAGASTGAVRAGGALNVLFAAIVAALPWAALVGIISVIVLMRRYRT